MLDDFIVLIPKEDLERINQQIDKLMEQENKKQSSIDWLVEQLKKQGFLYDLDIEQAKAMHKEEVINAVVWFDDTDRRPHEIEIEVKKYYNETFKEDK